MSSISNALTQTNNEFNSALSQKKGSNLDKESFLLLLVTQFKYQDPLNPMEDKEFISQMAQFSSLEQLMNLNTSMEGLTDATNNQQMINATSYIGKSVFVTGNKVGKLTDSTTENYSVSTFRYAFGDNVSSGFLTVKDANGDIVYTEDLSGKKAGTTFEFNWNGINNKGTVAADGVYTINLTAFNAKGESVLAAGEVAARVTGTEVGGDGSINLTLEGGASLPLGQVRQVTSTDVTNTYNNKGENVDDAEKPKPENPGDGNTDTENPGDGSTDTENPGTGTPDAGTPGSGGSEAPTAQAA